MHAFVLTPAPSRSLHVFRSTALGRPVTLRVSAAPRRSVIAPHAPFFPLKCQQEADSPAEADQPEAPEPQVSQPEAVADAPAADSAAPTAQADQNDDAAAGEKKRRRRTRPKREVTLPLEDLTEGMELEGYVKGVMQYGAFIGGLGTPSDGLIHVSQLADGFVQNVGDVVKVGDKVKVRVISVDLEKKTFALSLKSAEQLEKEKRQRQEREDYQEQRSQQRRNSEQRKLEAKKKWETFTHDPEKYIPAKILSITDFGAFCQILNEDNTPSEEAPTDGLIHISELSVNRVEKVTDVVSEGQIVQARILSTDSDRNRISMTLVPLPTPEEIAKMSQKQQRLRNTYVNLDSSSSSDVDMNMAQGRARTNRRSRDRKQKEEQVNIAAELNSEEANQPVFKTSFQIAFEKANIPIPEPTPEPTPDPVPESVAE